MPEPRPRDDGLGRAGRTGKNGGPVETARVRDMTPEDERRARVDGRHIPGVVIEGATIIYTPPAEHAERGEHRGLQYLDGKSEPRVPRSFEDALAERSREQDREAHDTLARNRRRERARMSVSALFGIVERQLLTMGQPRAKQSRETDARSANARDMSPQGEGHGAVGFLAEGEADRLLRLAHLAGELLHEAYDAHRGVAVTSYSMMPSHEKDALLCGSRLRGFSPDEIAVVFGRASDGRQVLGSAKNIRHVRACAGLDQFGFKLEEKAA